MLGKIKSLFNNVFLYNESKDYDFTLPEFLNIDTFKENKKLPNVSPKIDENLNLINVTYNSLINSDVKIREFTLIAENREYKAFLVYLDGMSDSTIINNFVLKPLMMRNTSNLYQASKSQSVLKNPKIRVRKTFNLEDYIYKSLIPQNDIKKISDFKELISEINTGNCILFVNGLNVAFNIDAKGFKSRSISVPNNEAVVRGSQEAFVEVLRTNTSIIRRLVNNENLVIENINVGKISKTKVAVCYLKNIANDDLIGEVKFRINNLDIDSLVSSGQLEQLIQDNGSSLPQMIATERPDKAVNHLFEGRVVIIVNGSPYVLIVPCVLVDFISSPEDLNLKYQYSNMLRIVRLIAALFTLQLPAFYLAVSMYHQELIPTSLLFAIAASRESVPFSVFFEIILMEVSFELIREAGLRVPSPIGPTIGIVGALILGEAAVSADIVSPILIIIIAITGICSFAIPDFSLSFSFRFLRFIFLILAFIAGLLGIAVCAFISMCVLANLKSFGVPYTAPYLPSTSKNSRTSFFVRPIWKREKRPPFLKSKDKDDAGTLSMLWKKPLSQEGDK